MKKKNHKTYPSKSLQNLFFTIFVHVLVAINANGKNGDPSRKKNTKVLHFKKTEQLFRETPIQDYSPCNNVAAARFASPS